MRAHTAATSISPPRSVAKRAASGVAVAALVTSGLALGAGTAQAASFTLADAQNPDFGPNVTIFDPSQSTANINQVLRTAALDMSGEINHWTTKRRAFFFKPGTYGNAAYAGAADDPTQIVNSDVGYYTSIAGLGLSPDDVNINGALHVEPEQVCPDTPWWCQGPGSLNNFWRSLSNLAIQPIQRAYGADAARAVPEGIVEANRMRWAVSQAAPMRRVHIKGDLTYMGRFGAYASGGFTADSKIDGLIQTGSQQQFFHRDSSIGSYAEPGVWNIVFSGTTGAPADNYPDSALDADANAANKHANYGNTPLSREAPFLTWNATDGYGVWVPGVRTNVSGTSWSGSNPGPGARISLDNFVVAKPGTGGSIDVDALNAAIAAGKHILFTPGEYLLNKPLKVTKSNTVVLGIGLATLRPVNGNAAITVSDVEGVKIAGLMIEAHSVKSDVLVQVGPRGASQGSASNPTTLSDVFFRIGGAQEGKVETALEINSNNALVDNIWSWRADHGNDANVNVGYQWANNPADVGVRVNGNNVTALGLFVEHYQKAQTVWNGENGRTIFYQSEIPYEPITQAQFSDRGREGYSSYKVDASVTNHELFGAGIYSYYRWVDTVWAENGISVPKKSTVSVRRAVTRWLNGCQPALSQSKGIAGCTDGVGGGIRHIVNDQGGSAHSGAAANDNDRTKWMREYNSSTGDLVKPTLTIAGPSAGASLAQLTATANDAGGTPANLIHIDYKVGNSLWYPASAGGIITPPNGTNLTVQVRAVDQAGNVSDVKTWTGTVNNPGNPGELYVPDTEGTGGNNGGGNNGGGTDLPPGSGTDPKNPGQGTNPNGTLTIGTKLSAKIRVTPTKASGNRGWHRKAVTLAASGTLEAGKAGFLQIKVGSAAWRTYTGPAKVTTNGKKVVLQARVVSGTTVSPVDSATVKIDTKKPTKLKVKVLKKKKKGAKVLRLSATDKTSKIAKIQYKVNAKGKWKTFKKAKGIRVTAKLKKISIRAIDKAGNVSKAKKVKVKAKWRR